MTEAERAYRLADRTISALDRLAIRRFSQARQRMILDGFDELNVMKTMNALYAGLDRDNRSAYSELFSARYAQALAETAGNGNSGGDGIASKDLRRFLRDREDSVDELAEAYLSGLLEEPNAVTHYVYDAEVLRKRDRATEAVNAAKTKGEKISELDKALRFWAQMSQQYADATSDGATARAYRDAGVRRVKWHTRNDQSVCRECDELDEKIFPINKLPDKPHWRCRCWISPEPG